MPRRRPPLFLAMLAALVMAPSSVSAAAPNELREADVSPGSGWTTTSFAFSVEYYSSAGNPAQSVDATVAGIDLPLLLVSGTRVDGTWRGARLLPVGTWTVSFRADVAKGPRPSLTYGTVTVSGVTATPSSGSGGPSYSADDPSSGGGSTLQPAPQVSATPRPSTKPAPETEEAQPGSTAAPAPSGGGADPGPRASERQRTRRDRSTDPSTTPAGAAGTESPSGPSPAPGPADKPGTPPMLSLVLLLGLSAVGAVALVGTAWVLLAARRERETAPVEAAEPAERDVTMRAVARVEQRAMRRARLHPSEDPILAGLGLEAEAPKAASPRAPASRTASPRRRPGDRPRR